MIVFAEWKQQCIKVTRAPMKPSTIISRKKEEKSTETNNIDCCALGCLQNGWVMWWLFVSCAIYLQVGSEHENIQLLSKYNVFNKNNTLKKWISNSWPCANAARTINWQLNQMQHSKVGEDGILLKFSR